MAIDHFDCCVVGAGVVGLACARALAMRGYSTIVLEKSNSFGSGISSRSSEVIHAGIYYPTDSLKARLCVEGKQLLYEYCQRKAIPHRRLGKLIVATNDEQIEQLSVLASKANANGVSDLEWVDPTRLKNMEPLVRAKQALLSPSTGIIDSHILMSRLAQDLEAEQGLLSLNTEFMAATQCAEGFRVEVCSVGETYRFHCDYLVNAAGLGAPNVASRIDGCPPDDIPDLYLCRGCYFSMSGPAPFRHLIYPVPEPNNSGLGIHATLDLAGQVRFGPDVEYVDQEDYSIPQRKAFEFTSAIQRYFPSLDPQRLVPAYAGIRPKLQGPGREACDFEIRYCGSGLINLFGFESPGLTASLAIGATVSSLINRGTKKAG